MSTPAAKKGLVTVLAIMLMVLGLALLPGGAQGSVWRARASVPLRARVCVLPARACERRV